MSLLVGGYVSARKCTGGPTAGAKALMSWFLGAYADDGGKNLGIYNCRSVRGGTTTSLHGEGRATDLGINPHGAAWGWEVANFLRLHSRELGIQCLIYARKIWSSSYSGAGWRDYGGKADHFDHIHAELTPWGAADLTVALLVAQARPVISLPPPPVLPALDGSHLPTLSQGMTNSPSVRRMQEFCNKFNWTPNLPLLKADGDYGPATTRVIAAAQRQMGVTGPDAVGTPIGPRTNRAFWSRGYRG